MTVEATRHGGRDPHDVLDVPRGADRQQVMQAFRLKARQGGHPDTGGDARSFEELIRARDELLHPARPATDMSSRRTTPVARSPSARPRPAGSPRNTAPPAETSKLAMATGLLALLGPLFWPAAILVGHLARRHARRTGQGGGTFASFVLFVLYVFTFYALVFVAVLVVDPQ